MTEHVIYIVFQKIGAVVAALCWRHTKAEADAVVERLRGELPALDDPLAPVWMWVSPLSDVPPGITIAVDACPDRACQRAGGHEGPHMSRSLEGSSDYSGTQVIEEWDDHGNREVFR